MANVDFHVDFLADLASGLETGATNGMQESGFEVYSHNSIVLILAVLNYTIIIQ